MHDKNRLEDEGITSDGVLVYVLAHELRHLLAAPRDDAAEHLPSGLLQELTRAVQRGGHRGMGWRLRAWRRSTRSEPSDTVAERFPSFDRGTPLGVDVPVEVGSVN